MNRYSSYKPSGVKWLGEIPSHWEMKRLGKICSFSKGLQFTKADLIDKGIPVVSYGQVHAKYNSRKHLSEDLIRYIPNRIAEGNEKSKVGIGDFIVADTSEDVDGCGNMAYNDCRKELYGGYHTILIKDLRIENKKYLAYLFDSNSWRAQIRSVVSGVKVYTVSRDILKNSYIIIPPFEEQSAIAAYLDTATAKIDAAIAQQQKMIDLLNERKQIIINRAVTKGLNPNAKMKDSGVEWIGEVPEHWEVMRMRYICSITTGNKDTINRVDDGLYPFYVRSPKVERINTYSYDGEAVLMAGDGVGAGKVFHYVNGKFDYHQRVYNFYNIKKIKAKLLYYYMKSHFRYVIEQLSAKSTVDSVRLNMIQDFLVVIPPMQEQLDLIDYLDSQMKNLDDSISMFENQISLLQERKQIIINEVVTGKVKVV